MTICVTPFEALQEAVRITGGQSALARICGVSQTAVWKWLQSSKRLPGEYVLRVEATTRVSRHNLRPDLYPLTLPASGVPIELVETDPPVACDQQDEAQARDAA